MDVDGTSREKATLIGNKQIDKEDISISHEKGEDVKSLLSFINLASDNIKASLDRSTSCKRAVDHRKYLQKQLQHFTNLSQPLSSSGGPTYPPCTASVVKNNPDQPQCISAKTEHTTPATKYHCSVDQAYRFNNELTSSIKAFSYDPDVKNSVPESPVLSTVNFRPSMATSSNKDRSGNTNITDKNGLEEETDEQLKYKQRDTKSEDLMDSLFKQSQIVSSEKLMPSSTGEQKSVPLRQRSLPASFWKEPNNPQWVNDKYASAVPLPPFHTQLSPRSLPHNHGTLDHLYRLPPGVSNIPFPTTSCAHNSFAELSLKRLSSLDYPKIQLPGQFDEAVTARLDYFRNLPYGLPNSSRLLPVGNYSNGMPSIPYMDSTCSTEAPRITESINPMRLHGQSCVDCCRPHESLPLPTTVGGVTVQMPPCCRIPPVNSVLCHRPSLWKPIPTKTVSSFPSRYHPFAGVH